jgi:hypothetical protein
MLTPGQAQAAAGTPSQYSLVTPVRILDTRSGRGGYHAPLGPGGSINVQISGQGGVPSTAVTAVAINVTVTNTTTNSYLTVYPTGVPLPTASNLNWVAGETVPNLVHVQLGTGGQVTVFNFAGSADVIFDVDAYLTAWATSGGSVGYVPVTPCRIVDTRLGYQGITTIGGGTNFQVSGNCNVPSSPISGVALNVTVTNPTTSSYLTLWSVNALRPTASNLNFVAGQTVANRVVVAVSSQGQVSIYNAFGRVDVIVDVNGWFGPCCGPASAGWPLHPMTPTRILDTRSGLGGFSSPIGAQSSILVPVAGQAGIPLMSSSTPPMAIVANITGTNATAGSYFTLWPDNVARPTASDVNFSPGWTVPNQVLVTVGADGKVGLFNAFGSADAVLDVVGWYG